jgi:hypothetical protein
MSGHNTSFGTMLDVSPCFSTDLEHTKSTNWMYAPYTLATVVGRYLVGDHLCGVFQRPVQEEEAPYRGAWEWREHHVAKVLRRLTELVPPTMDNWIIEVLSGLKDARVFSRQCFVANSKKLQILVVADNFPFPS